MAVQLSGLAILFLASSGIASEPASNVRLSASDDDPGRNRPRLSFENRLREPVVVDWVAPGGERRRIGRIPPGRTLSQDTSRGHRFVVTGIKSDFERVAVVDAAERTVVLAEPEGPNVLVLMADDWSWSHSGAYGDPVVRTPNVDRLAREGALFEHAFVSAPSCTPSRMAIATGQWHWRLGEAANLGGSLGADVPVYPERLEAEGYRIGYARKGAAPSKHVHRGRDPFGPRFDSLTAFLEDRRPGEPFCFWYGAGEPHRPYTAGTGVARGLDPKRIQIPAGLPDHEVIRSDLCDYLADVERFDGDVGRMIELLRKTGDLDETLVIVAGDNGMPFPRCKATLYDTGTRVPLIVRWPGRIPAGRRVRDIVNLTDLAPTILQAADVDVPRAVTGQSLWPLFGEDRTDPAAAERTWTLTGMERHVYAHPSRAIRTHDFLFIRNLAPREWRTGETGREPRIDFAKKSWPTFPGAFSFNIDPSPTKSLLLDRRDDPALRQFFARATGLRPDEELYDLRRDPGQLRNVATDPAYRDRRDELRGRLERALRASGDPRFRTAKGG